MKTVTRNITGQGIAILVGASMFVIAGFFAREGALITLGICGLILVGVCGWIAPRNLRNLGLQLRMPHRFHATRSISFEAELQNGRRVLDAYQVELTMRFPQRVQRLGRADWTPAGGHSLLHDRLSIPVRSSADEVGYEFSSTFPLGLFQARLTSAVSCPMLVYPRPITPKQLATDGSQPDLMPTTAGAAAGDSFGEPRGIRPYQPGDAANRIHLAATARSLARGHGLRSRAYDPPGFHPHRCRVIFHSFAKGGELLRLDRFERGLSLIAGTLGYFQAIHTKVTLQADFADWRCHPCENRTQYFQCLALLAQAKRPKGTEDQKFADILKNVPTDEQIIIISDSPPMNWRELIPNQHQHVVIIDIQHVRFQRRKIRLAELN